MAEVSRRYLEVLLEAIFEVQSCCRLGGREINFLHHVKFEISSEVVNFYQGEVGRLSLIHRQATCSKLSLQCTRSSGTFVFNLNSLHFCSSLALITPRASLVSSVEILASNSQASFSNLVVQEASKLPGCALFNLSSPGNSQWLPVSRLLGL